MCVLGVCGGAKGVKAECVLGKGVNGLYVWGEKVKGLSVFWENQIQSWRGGVCLCAGGGGDSGCRGSKAGGLWIVLCVWGGEGLSYHHSSLEGKLTCGFGCLLPDCTWAGE